MMKEVIIKIVFEAPDDCDNEELLAWLDGTLSNGDYSFLPEDVEVGISYVAEARKINNE